MAKSHLTLRQLEIFLAVVERGSFRRAGDAMNLASVVIGEHMRTLEARLGGPLFERRSGSKPLLTDLGHSVLSSTRDVMAAVERLETAAAALQPQAQWKFGFLPFMSRHLADRITELRRRFPDCKISTDLRDENIQSVFDRVGSGELHLAMAITTEERLQDVPPSVEVKVVIEEPLALFVSHKHPLAGRRSLKIADLLDFPMAGLPSGHPLRILVDSVFDSAGLAPRERGLETNNYNELLQHISGSTSIGCMFAEVESSDAVAHRLQVLDLENDLPVPQAIVIMGHSHHNDRRLAMAAEFLSNHYRFGVASARTSRFLP